MSQPLQNLSPAKQNSRQSPVKAEFGHKFSNSEPLDEIDQGEDTPVDQIVPTITGLQLRLPDEPQSLPSKSNSSPLKPRSPVKYRLQEDAHAVDSPPGSPAEPPILREETPKVQEPDDALADTNNEGVEGVHMDDRSTATTTPSFSEPKTPDGEDETEITLSIDRTLADDTMGDLSTISAIPTDLTRFANLRSSPTKTPREALSPTKQLRSSILISIPGTVQRPLHLLSSSRHSYSGNEDAEATPRARGNSTTPADLLDFTGQSNVLIPPPSTTRPIRRSPSGRGAFPIRVNPTPNHRSAASVHRERSAGRTFDTVSVATPSDKRRSMYGMPTGFGSDLLDLDLEPMATPRSIPTITPRELETLRSELQSRISGLEATLSGKEAEVMALKRAVTDAEVRVGKTSEDLRNERGAKELFEQQRDEMEASNRQMEDMLRELKQNAFVDERERDKLRRQAEEAERCVEEHEVKILELHASLDTLQSDRLKHTPSPSGTSAIPCTPGSNADVDRAVKEATETVARELHALYKSKHERKVADLKVSYEKRWQKQVEQLRADMQLAQEEILRLQTEKEATMSGVVPGQLEAMSKMEGQIQELRRWNEEISGEKKVIEAEVVGLKSSMDKFQSEYDHLRKELENERAEKGDLVAQVDLFLTMSAAAEMEKQQQRHDLQQQQQQLRESERPRSQPPSPRKIDDGAVPVPSPNKFRTSGVGVQPGARQRPQSMLMKPTAGFSKLPGPGPSGLKAPSKFGAAGYARSGGLMDGITRMGAGGR